MLHSKVPDPQLFETISCYPSHFPSLSANYQSTFGQVSAVYCRSFTLLLSQATIPSAIHINSSQGKTILILCTSRSGSSLLVTCFYSTLMQGLDFTLIISCAIHTFMSPLLSIITPTQVQTKVAPVFLM
jgi:hypothetical protein